MIFFPFVLYDRCPVSLNLYSKTLIASEGHQATRDRALFIRCKNPPTPPEDTADLEVIKVLAYPLTFFFFFPFSIPHFHRQGVPFFLYFRLDFGPAMSVLCLWDYHVLYMPMFVNALLGFHQPVGEARLDLIGPNWHQSPCMVDSYIYVRLLRELIYYYYYYYYYCYFNTASICPF